MIGPAVTAQELFKVMLRDRIAPALRGLGLKGSGQEFILPSATHWALLGSQRDRYSDARGLRFTVNVNVIERGVWTRAHAAHPWIGPKPRSIVSGYALRDSELPGFWHRRIGQLMGRDDHWWSVDTRTDTEALAGEVVNTIASHVLPRIRERMTQ